MFKLGLTGSIATGKSTALDAFEEVGYPTFSADQAVHHLYSGEAVAPISKLFPGAIIKGKVDRTRLSTLLRQNPAKLEQINQIVHPLVQKKIKNFTSAQAATGKKLIIIEIPLLFEAGRDGDFDAIAVTWCSDDLQKQRALLRPEMDVEKLQLILAHQMPQSDKKQRADFLIDTNGSIKDTAEQVEKIAKLCLMRTQQMP